MIRIKPIGLIAGALFVTSLVSKTVSAEEDQGYQRDVSSGLHVYSDSSSGSLLSAAARNGGSVVIRSAEEYEEPSPFVENKTQAYTVKKGDTLWEICSSFFGDPYVWPLVWSYNTKITNPNWIYPGDVIWLSPPPTEEMLAAAQPMEAPDTGVALVARLPSALMIRNRGFVDKETLKQSGELVGAHKAVMMVAQFDEAYVEFKENEQVRPGDEFAAYQVIRTVDAVEDPDTEAGYLVEILGQARVTSYNKDNRIARVVIDEAARPIERGTLIGPIHRRFDLIPTVKNSQDMEGHLIAVLDPVILSATHHIVFIDRGAEHGVREGNRFFAVERRDTWRQSRDEKDDREGYPKEVLAELRVVETRPQTSTCLITSAVRELEVGQKVEMRKGY